MKPLSRRQLLQRGAGLALAWTGAGRVLRAGAEPAAPHTTMAMPRPHVTRPLRASRLARFVDALPIPPVQLRAGTAPDPARRGRQVPLYRVHMREVEASVHRDLPPARFWSYGAGMPGPTLEVRSGEPVAIEWRNDLPTRHFLPIDHTMCGADASAPEVRTVVHVHGAKVPPESDGYPDRWFTPGHARTVHYPNQQDAATLWYHDHAMGIERLNQYAGLFGAYLIRDHVEDELALPDGPHEIPLFIFDRILDEDGQLQYPTSGNPDTPWVPEVYGDTILVNGTYAPRHAVERRAYRFRIVNASNARFLYLSLSSRTPMIQIGSDQGLLAAPVKIDKLSLAPAERADVIIDFGPLAGQHVVLMSQAFELARFEVAAGKPIVDWQPPSRLRDVPRVPASAAVKTRSLGIDEYGDPQHGMLMLLDGKRWRDPVTETPELDTTEIWELVNYTGDTHPIHLHLVRFQILDRQRLDIDAFRYLDQRKLMGPPIPPEVNERGWKDTVQAHPESITRIIVKFEGYAGRYVWHCHVLEHAANEMMRPFEVRPRRKR
ncbi:MAG TPA: multicopper oxidase domain-containing protein [Kofleriaceae bacterium]|nr:multicopper oxidase domain-containing protein [Kofleriaceae bacterium]